MHLPLNFLNNFSCFIRNLQKNAIFVHFYITYYSHGLLFEDYLFVYLTTSKYNTLLLNKKQ